MFEEKGEEAKNELGVAIFFFFKQKTAYEMLRSLVGSEMCIRDRSVIIGILHLSSLGIFKSMNKSFTFLLPIASFILSLIHI
ncbi:hypothetical protein CDFC105_33132 [Clostridioides difficile]|nr:hypothetical protein CDFC105_33132 [Clostridioides difficile]